MGVVRGGCTGRPEECSLGPGIRLAMSFTACSGLHGPPQATPLRSRLPHPTIWIPGGGLTAVPRPPPAAQSATTQRPPPRCTARCWAGTRCASRCCSRPAPTPLLQTRRASFPWTCFRRGIAPSRCGAGRQSPDAARPAPLMLATCCAGAAERSPGWAVAAPLMLCLGGEAVLLLRSWLLLTCYPM
jgi:hypothetical protein